MATLDGTGDSAAPKQPVGGIHARLTGEENVNMNLLLTRVTRCLGRDPGQRLPWCHCASVGTGSVGAGFQLKLVHLALVQL